AGRGNGEARGAPRPAVAARGAAVGGHGLPVRRAAAGAHRPRRLRPDPRARLDGLLRAGGRAAAAAGPAQAAPPRPRRPVGAAGAPPPPRPQRGGAPARAACRRGGARAAVARQRRAQVRRDAKQRRRPVSRRKLDLCDWNILLTNAPPALLAARDAGAVRRVRWQIELVFKVFKSEGGLEKTLARDRWRVLAELYGKLL